MLQSYRKNLFHGEKPVKTANSLISVEVRGFDRCSDDSASREQILEDTDRLTQYYPYLSQRLVADLMIFQFYLIDLVYKNDDLRLTICAASIDGGNAPYKGTRFQIDSQKYQQAIILDFFDLTLMKVVDKHWLYSAVFPKKEDDPETVEPLLEYLGIDQFLDETFEPELNNFSFQTFYTHRMRLGEHIQPYGYVHQYGKVFTYFHGLINQLKHYGVHVVAWLRPGSRVIEFHHVGIPDTAQWKPKGALILHMVKTRAIEDGWDTLEEDQREEMNTLYGCQIFT